VDLKRLHAGLEGRFWLSSADSCNNVSSMR
jgi:hypothetical protein